MKTYEAFVLLLAPLGTGLAAFDYANGWDSTVPLAAAANSPTRLALRDSEPGTATSQPKLRRTSLRDCVVDMNYLRSPTDRSSQRLQFQKQLNSRTDFPLCKGSASHAVTPEQLHTSSSISEN